MEPSEFLLLVEDNPVDEQLMIEAMEKAGFTGIPVVVARDGAEALEYLSGTGRHSGRDPRNLPRVVVLDLKLPKIDGLDVLREIRRNVQTKLIPVVVLTSSVEEADLTSSYELGASSYVRKQVDFRKFSEEVKQLGAYWLKINRPPPAAITKAA